MKFNQGMNQKGITKKYCTKLAGDAVPQCKQVKDKILMQGFRNAIILSVAADMRSNRSLTEYFLTKNNNSGTPMGANYYCTN